ncbi:MAG: TetR/AcrR family transcriptional regulator [Solirubrobacteraceae bacterium]
MDEPNGRIADARPRRPSSRAGRKARLAGEDPRSRMLEAMLSCVGEQGYLPTVVADVIAKAVASRKTFYEHFEDRQACFLALSDEIGSEWVERVSAACEHATAEDGSSAVDALIAELFALGCERPAALRIVAVEMTAAGPAGVARRERLLADLSAPLQPEIGEQPSSLLLARSIVGAALRMLYARARRGAGVRRPRRGVAQELADGVSSWARRYTDRDGLPEVTEPAQDAQAPDAPVGGRAPGTLSLSSRAIERRGLPRGEGNVSRSFVIHSQRERILDALANLAAAEGYGAATIPEIVREAAVSVQAFYEHFSGKDDAFLVAYEIGHRKALAIVERAYEAQELWPQAIGSAIATLLEFLASEPAYAHLALIDALTASPKAASIAHDGLIAYSAMLEPGITGAEEEPWAAVAPEATATALLELCFVYVSDERARELPRLRDLACEIALRPFSSLSVR